MSSRSNTQTYEQGRLGNTSLPVSTRMPFNGLGDTIAYATSLAQHGRGEESIRSFAMNLTKGIPVDPRTNLPDRRNFVNVARAIYDWMKYTIAYVRDPHFIERIQSPEVTLQLQSGDCDDMSVLGSALLMSLGIPCRFVVIGQKGSEEYSHIYFEFEYQNNWYPFDVVLATKVGDAIPGEQINKRQEVMLDDAFTFNYQPKRKPQMKTESGFLDDSWIDPLFGSGKGNTQFNETANDKVSFFEHDEYKGKFISLSPGEYDVDVLRSAGMNDSISSIKIPKGFTVKVYTDPLISGGGLNATYNKSVVNMAKSAPAFNDKISAIHISGAWDGTVELYQSISAQGGSDNSFSATGLFNGLYNIGQAIFGKSGQTTQQGTQVVQGSGGGSAIIPVTLGLGIAGGLGYWFFKKSRKKSRR